MATFGSSVMEFPGAGPLGCLTMAFIAAFKWRKEDWSKEGGVSNILHPKYLIPRVNLLY